jgi:hypothetical protein
MSKMWYFLTTEREMDAVNKLTIANTALTVDGIPLKQVNVFKYLGMVLG